MEYFFLWFLFKYIAQKYHLIFNLRYHSLAQIPKVCSAFALFLSAFFFSWNTIASLREHTSFCEPCFSEIFEITEKISEISGSIKLCLTMSSFTVLRWQKESPVEAQIWLTKDKDIIHKELITPNIA